MCIFHQNFNGLNFEITQCKQFFLLTFALNLPNFLISFQNLGINIYVTGEKISIYGHKIEKIFPVFNITVEHLIWLWFFIVLQIMLKMHLLCINSYTSRKYFQNSWMPVLVCILFSLLSLLSTASIFHNTKLLIQRFLLSTSCSLFSSVSV